MRTLIAVVLASALAMPACAQTEAALVPPGRTMDAPAPLTIRRIVPEVQMVITAEDRRGRPVLDLEPGQITVLDNGLAAPLTSWQAAENLPLRAALLVDESDSMRPGFAAERRAAIALALRMSGHGNQIFAISFAAREAATGSGGPANLISVRQLGGQTALYDALISAAERLSSTTPARRALVLLSDGEDNYSRATLGEAIAALQRAGCAVYSTSVHSRRLEYPGDRVLRQIAAATGGRAFVVSNYSRAAEILAGIEGELRGQYVVGFRPSGELRAGAFHSVKLIAKPRGVKLRARPGYYVAAVTSP